MKSTAIVFLSTILFVASVHAGCDDATSKDSEDGEVKAWFKDLGCKIQKGAGDIQESAKPWADKIGASAKEFGNTVVQKLKWNDDATSTAATLTAHQDAPTEKVPLAPLSGEGHASAAAGTDA